MGIVFATGQVRSLLDEAKLEERKEIVSYRNYDLHIFAMTVHCLADVEIGVTKSPESPIPRLLAFIRRAFRAKFSVFTGVNTYLMVLNECRMLFQKL